MAYEQDKRVVMTLDAGGNSFRFSAVQGNKVLFEGDEQITLPAFADNMEKCLNSLTNGFKEVEKKLKEAGKTAVAISFAFPGPADYKRGIIGDNLPNFPAFRKSGGFPMASYLKNKFNMPVYINNDGNLFAYGEALAGVLPDVNAKLEKAGSERRYSNILGLTFGTGFGAGIVLSGELLVGDNSVGGEIFSSRNYKYPEYFVEDSASIRGVQFAFAKYSGGKYYSAELTPKDIFDIADNKVNSDSLKVQEILKSPEANSNKPQHAAQLAFAEMGMVAGDTIADVITMIDGLVVIGGGLAGAHKFFMPAMLEQLNSKFKRMENDEEIARIPQKVYDLDDEQSFAEFAKGNPKTIKVPESDEEITYDCEPCSGVAVTKLGTSKSIMLGAYAFALNELDK